ncbi:MULTISPECIES: DUF2062 domain-containing protein [Prochlorococcus]|uniref:DUF2062 domain-containing protein n=1 Tax=Prochlorococcus marinus str. MIT 9116 TaxID=167544 RepID=A0A0A1ZKP2_PROMR|nr:DUF2062 domain-containing protein [Prochlorococcus marinus]KGF89219.1 hypothetical protein EU92_1774 [Prochlorococcus marinus str. MIT 9107]KGF89975.1 hypothetical protein EU93_1838 [Prochlorococcus marinus str. MIT 9116]KGF95411.1 hypothetical protein EU94_0120 [Prochlorococcus marinus str. MIT 9123]
MRSKRDISFKKILSLFRHQNGSPFYNAKGLAIGVFSGCFPFFGFQTLIGVFFAKLAKGNIVLAAIGTWISNPFTYIPLYYLNYKVGSIVLNNSSNNTIEKSFVIDDLWRQGRIFSLKLLLGSSCVGLLLALICGSIVFFIYKIKIKR